MLVKQQTYLTLSVAQVLGKKKKVSQDNLQLHLAPQGMLGP